MEGGKSREEVTRDRETLREEEKGGKDRGKTEARKPPNAFFSDLFLPLEWVILENIRKRNDAIVTHLYEYANLRYLYSHQKTPLRHPSIANA